MDEEPVALTWVTGEDATTATGFGGGTGIGPSPWSPAWITTVPFRQRPKSSKYYLH